jgi:hypothetical protein
VATASTFTANTIAGSYRVRVSSGAAPAANLSLTNLAGAVARMTITGGNDQSAKVGTAFAVSLQVALADSFGNPVPGVGLTFTAPSSGASGAFAAGGTGTTTVQTNASGVATASAFTANTIAGSYRVEVTCPGVDSQQIKATNLAASGATIAVTAGDDQRALVGTAFAVALRARVTDSFGNPRAGATVIFTVPSSGASARLASASATTDASGQAQVTATANGIVGSYTVIAQINGGAGATASFQLTNSANFVSLTGNSQSTRAGQSFAAPLIVRVSGSTGQPVVGAMVTFTAPSSGASARLSSASATTDASGQAQVIATANGIAGSYTVTAQLAGVPGATISFHLTNIPPLKNVFIPLVMFQSAAQAHAWSADHSGVADRPRGQKQVDQVAEVGR